MAWAKVDDRAPHHPKHFRAGIAAFGLFTAGICYCNALLTDGRIRKTDLPAVYPGTPQAELVALATILIRERLWEEDSENYFVHDFSSYQPLRKNVLLLRKQRKGAGRQGGINKAKNRLANAETLLQRRVANQNDGSSPVPSRPVPSLTTSPLPPNGGNGSAPHAPGFDAWYALYPRKAAKGHARKAWAKAVKIATPAEIIAGLRTQLADFAQGPPNMVPYPATWLNGESWTNEPLTPAVDGYLNFPRRPT